MRNRIRIAEAIIATAVVLPFSLIPSIGYAQSATVQPVERAVVTSVISTLENPPDAALPNSYNETVDARLITGPTTGSSIEMQVTYAQDDGQKLSVGDTVYVLQTAGGSYTSVDHYRLPVVVFFIILFLGCIVVIGGKQGIRGLVSLCGGIALIALLLIPGIMRGWSALLLSVIVACCIASIGAYITHGFSKMTTAAVVGMIATILIATSMADFAVHAAYLSGVTDDTTYTMLNEPTFAEVNFQGLLLGGIILGLLGVLYDAAIGQAVAVEELFKADPQMTRSSAYRRAFRIGREHIGALVNTLVLAYLGISLPIALSLYDVSLFSSAWSPVLNWEFVAQEIIRATIGAIGLMLTIPITTAIATWILIPAKKADAKSNQW